MKTSDLKKILQQISLITLLGLLSFTTSCKQNAKEDDPVQQREVDTTTVVREVEPRAFTGEIRSVGNSGDVSGEIAMRIEGGLMRFNITADGLAPDMMHIQYLLVSQTGDETQCPGSVEDVTNAESNQGTTATSGTTLRRIPLHMGGTLDMESDTYPRTNINGELQFSHVISLDSLKTQVRNEYQMQDLDFSKFTFVIRGIPDKQSSSAKVSGSTGSVENTPVGCAKLQETVISD